MAKDKKKNNDKGGLNGLPSDKNKKTTSKSKGKENKTGKSYTTGGGGTDTGSDTGKSKGGKGRGADKGSSSSSSGSSGGGGGSSSDDMLEWQKKEAEKARQDEKDRQNRIDKGMVKIDEAFAGFDETFYDTREQEYKDYYMSQAEPEFKKARENLTFALARAGLGTTAGTVGSTAEATSQAENEFGIQSKTADISAHAADARSKTEAQIALEKSALVSTLNETAKANQIGNEATAKTAQLASTAPDYNWVPDVFYGAAQGVGGMVQAAQNAQYASTFNGGTSAPTIRNSTTIY